MIPKLLLPYAASALAATIASAGLILPAVAEAASPPAATGQWTVQPGPHTDQVQLELTIARSGHRHVSGHDVPLADLTGLSADELARGGDVMFRLQRDAGSIVMQGSIEHQKGRGRFDLFLRDDFADELVRRGVGRPTREQQIQLVLEDGRLALLDELQADRYPTPNVDLFVRCVEHGITTEYLRGMIALGYRLGTIDEMVKARDHGVDPDFVAGMNEAGFGKLTYDQLLRARDHGADAAYAGDMRAAGFKLTLDELITTRDHGVDAEFMRELSAEGYRDLPLAKLVELRDHGVDAQYLVGLKRMGYTNLSIADVVEARNHGVDANFIGGLQDSGYPSVTLAEAIRARDHGVDAAFATTAQKRLGRRPSLDELIRMRDAGELNP